MKHIKCVSVCVCVKLLGRATQQVRALKFTLLWINEFMKENAEAGEFAIKVSILSGFFRCFCLSLKLQMKIKANRAYRMLMMYKAL